jgi:hypothetical protein
MGDLLRILPNDERRTNWKGVRICKKLDGGIDCIAIPYEYDSILKEICNALGWLGGTRQ